MNRCGRRRVDGTPCQAWRVTRFPFGEFGGCSMHLTDDELDQREADVLALKVAIRAYDSEHAEPACWSWPISDAHREAVAADGVNGLAVWQDRRCGLCGARGRLVLDHDHDSGQCRGWLCRSCNGREPGGGRRAIIAWRERPAAALFGLSERYWSSWSGFAEPAEEQQAG